jgi:hypothetical protein
MEQQVDSGSCFCGRIVAQITGEPFWINFDHDDDCRKALGSPLTIWVGYQRQQVRYVSGSPKTFSKTPGVQRGFCADCGSSISYVDDGLDGEIWIAIGFMDQPERFEPQAHGYWKMKLPWIDFADDLPRFDTYSRKRDPSVGFPSERR